MRAALVKIDVAAADLDKSVRLLRQLTIGGDMFEDGLEWVFNLANNPEGKRRDLRFWRPELLARQSGQPASQMANLGLEYVIDQSLPVKRVRFHASEVDQLLQIRPRTRIDLDKQMPGQLIDGTYWYDRTVIAAFLRNRWLGATIVIKK
jgi:hypothetical protein